MFEKAATTTPASESSKKCPGCGIRNFASATQCKRCKADLSLSLNETSNDKLTLDGSGESGRSMGSWIFAAVAVVLLGVVVLVYMRQGPQVSAAAKNQAAVAQPAAADAEEPAEDPAEQNARSEEVATEVLTDLKRFQYETEAGMAFNDYEAKLARLQAELNSSLPGFARHEPADETFRQEIDAAVRDHVAAANWWKTVIRNDGVFDEADRKERTQALWDSARTHLATAEKMLVRRGQ